jgi:hypothetical protein
VTVYASSGAATPFKLQYPGTPGSSQLTSSVLLAKWFILGRIFVEGRFCSKQRLLYEVTVSGLKAVQADPFQRGYQLGQCRDKLPSVLAHQHVRV